ncbi:hypothetical protein BDP27DRAFT_1415505 [Rhodocollybia butyracea]|uniref:Uncharacterized protein n=1 Tax=Rhodocollybia butyracea TaxID=206335 RepID=A0A9P5Q5U9_9AGAR|nr:hypothetical protein BDP27DRAFT_1415505 [Rhodocollybia butyracea]
MLLSLSTFLSLPSSLHATKSESYLTVIPSLFLSYVVAKPLWWVLEQVGVVGEDSLAISVSSTFSSFGSGASKSDTRWYGPADALYTFDSFRREFAECLNLDETASMGELDMKVILRYLERDKGVVVVDDGVVKFVEDDEDEITAVDRGILELKTAVANLRAQIEGIHRKMDLYLHGESWRSSETEKHKSIALCYLRSKKQLDELLSKRMGALGGLEGTLIQVEGAAGDIVVYELNHPDRCQQILKSYKASTTTLRSILSHPSLQRDSIDQTMEAMAEANADAREIDDAVRIGGDIAVGVSDIDDDELEEELKKLTLESEREKEEMESSTEARLDGIPETPSHTVLYITQSRPDSNREAIQL